MNKLKGAAFVVCCAVVLTLCCACVSRSQQSNTFDDYSALQNHFVSLSKESGTPLFADLSNYNHIHTTYTSCEKTQFGFAGISYDEPNGYSVYGGTGVTYGSTLVEYSIEARAISDAESVDTAATYLPPYANVIYRGVPIHVSTEYYAYDSNLWSGAGATESENILCSVMQFDLPPYTYTISGSAIVAKKDSAGESVAETVDSVIFPIESRKDLQMLLNSFLDQVGAPREEDSDIDTFRNADIWTATTFKLYDGSQTASIA